VAGGKETVLPQPGGRDDGGTDHLTGSTFGLGTPVNFPTRIYGGGGVDAQQGRQYDVAPDGRRSGFVTGS
jgi:hypothetical protein